MTRQTAAEIEQEAVFWLMRIDREGRTPQLKAELDTWVSADPRRQGALLQAEAAWAMLDRLGDDHSAADEEEPAPPGLLTRRRVLGVAAGTGSALAASLAFGVYWWGAGTEFRTTVGEIRRVPLADGSSATINTASDVRVRLEKSVRHVRIDQGEVWFQVAKDRARPFIVEAGRIRVEAVGTAFSVRRRDDGADVLVTEGIVEAWADGAEGAKIRLGAGERAFVADNAAVTHNEAKPSEVDRALAWRGGKIDLAGETLAQAAAEFNRYNQQKLTIIDPRLAGERFYGIFRTDDPGGFATAVNRSLGAPVETSENGNIVIGQPSS
ncbi:FecR domain-containing protein [Sphingobium sp. H39-3-25]|uniref:FecR family protein n=1 Tax=Sphingomonadales TaxID=204457 RepID=UPI00082D1AFE|nr:MULTISPECIES: FecR domain-containing protein [Sphingomonadaceae]MDF0491086.1 FecR domain-containing protein [Sphingomonas pollutisoli]MDF0545183.1 FecR domain-containing protein [Sphingobium arseniciresistens]